MPAAGDRSAVIGGGVTIGQRGDEVVVGSDGESAISMEDYAVAVLDEAETPRHACRRFTVGY